MTIKTILYVAVSKDGFIASEDGSVAWLDEYNELGEDYGYKDFMERIDTVMMGNTTYRQVLGFGSYPYKGKKSYVFASEEGDDENATFVSGDVKIFMDSLSGDHTIFLVGGADVIGQFLHYDLIDEFIIFTMPKCLGNGIALFSDKTILERLDLTKTKTWPSGVVEKQYRKNVKHSQDARD